MPAATSSHFSKASGSSAGSQRSSAKHKSSGSSPSGGFSPLRWVRRLFTRPLMLARVGRQWHLVFAQSLLAIDKKSPSRGEALRLGHIALQELLAQHGDTRDVVPHLSHLEQALARAGSRALTVLPTRVLQRALEQLDMLEGTQPQRSEHLMGLRLRIDQAIKRGTPVNLKGDIANIEVCDASASQYFEAEDDLTNRMALDERFASTRGTVTPR